MWWFIIVHGIRRCNISMYEIHPCITLIRSDVCTVNVTFVYFACDWWPSLPFILHYDDVIMGAITSQITSLTIVYSTVYSHADQRKHQSSASLVFVRGIHRGPMNSPHKWPVTRKMFPFDDVIMQTCSFVAGDVHGYNLQRDLHSHRMLWCLSNASGT